MVETTDAGFWSSTGIFRYENGAEELLTIMQTIQWMANIANDTANSTIIQICTGKATCSDALLDWMEKNNSINTWFLKNNVPNSVITKQGN